MASSGFGTASALMQSPACHACSPVSFPSRGSRAQRPVTRVAAADLKQQLVTSILQDKSLPGIRHAVTHNSGLLLASKDWQQLQSVFAAAASQPAPNVPDPLQQAPLPTQRSAGGSSPWGFALRQPNRTQPAASSSIPQLQQQAQQRQQRVRQWEWSSVQSFTVLGLGSIHALVDQGDAQQQVRVRHPSNSLHKLTAVQLTQHYHVSTAS